MGEGTLNEGRFRAWRETIKREPSSPVLDVFRHLIDEVDALGSVVRDLEDAAHAHPTEGDSAIEEQIAGFRASLGEVQLALGLREPARVTTNAQLSYSTLEQQCPNEKPHDPHYVPGFLGAIGFHCLGKGWPEDPDDPGPQDGSEGTSPTTTWEGRRERIGDPDDPALYADGDLSAEALASFYRQRADVATASADRAWAQAHAAAGKLMAAGRIVSDAMTVIGTDDRLHLLEDAIGVMAGTIVVPGQRWALQDEAMEEVVGLHADVLAAEREAERRGAEADILARQVDAQNVTLRAQAEMIDQLKSQVVSESVVDSDMFPPGYEKMFLPGHAERTATFWKRRYVSQIEPLTAEVEKLREFKRLAHYELDTAGVAPYLGVEHRIVERIRALSRVHLAADRQAQEHMRRANDYREKINELHESMSRMRVWVREVSYHLPSFTDALSCLTSVAMALDDHLPGYTPVFSTDRGQVYPEQEHDPETDAEDAVERAAQPPPPPGSKKVRMYRDGAVVREFIVPPGTIFDVVFDRAPDYDRLEYRDA